ncbi:MAG: hypothetical protein ACRYFS_21570 [Janthinobacterium lividum]
MIKTSFKSSLIPACLLLMLMLPLVPTAAAPAPPPLANAVILIIRHAEKPDSGPGLTPAGEQRAADYIYYFQGYKINALPEHIDHLVASADSKRSERPRLTVEPFSRAAKLPIDSRFLDKDVDALAQALEAKPSGRAILICWHHSEIPELLQDLGANPETLLPGGKWPSSIYNWVIQLRFDSKGQLLAKQAKRINEHLMPGDAD